MKNDNYKFLFSKYNRNVKKRIYGTFAILTIIIILLICRVFYIQYAKGAEYLSIAHKQYRYEENIIDTKYKLLDCNGVELREYERKYYVIIDPHIFVKMNKEFIAYNNIKDEKNFKDYKKKENLDYLIYILRNHNKDYDLSKMVYLNPNERMKFLIDKKTYTKLKDIKNIKGFYTYECDELKANKSWKIEDIISKYKNYQNDTMKGKNSLEMKIHEKTKENEYHKIILNKDRDFNIISSTYSKPKKNVNVRLTLDKKIQEVTREILKDDIYKKYDQIGVVIMEADTGKIRGMVEKDEFKSNPNIGIPSSNGFYPGSIFKTIIQEAALENNLIAFDKKYEVRRMFAKVHEKQKQYDAKEAFVQSSNDVFVQIGQQVGYKNIAKFANDQGLLDKVLGLHDEKNGNIEANPREIGDITNLCIGQNIRITPLEAISIPNTVINNGVYVRPKIIDSYVDDNNKVIETTVKEFKNVMTISTAKELKEQMISVVESENGTGRLAYINTANIEIGGKTGTTEYLEKKKEYSDGWFVGFFKFKDNYRENNEAKIEKNKYYSMVVYVKNIDIENEAAGNTAAPIFKRITEALMTL